MRRLPRPLAHLLPWLLAHAWLVLLAETLCRGSAREAAGWTAAHPLLFASGAVVLGCLTGLVGSLTLVRPAFWLVSAAAAFVGLASGVMLRTLGRSVLAPDLLLFREGGGVVQWREIANPLSIASIPIFTAGAWLLVHRLAPVPRLRLAGRLVLGIGSVAVGAGLFAAAPGIAGSVPQGISAPVRHHGLVLTEMLDLRERLSAEPPLPPESPPPAEPTTPQPPPPAPEHVPPNIVLVLSESFFDPTVLPGVHFDKDPLPFYRSLLASSQHGFLRTPEYGGATANVEFEVLTGLSRQFFPDGTIAYYRYVRRPIDSLASILARQGYRTAAITPWSHWFFNSEHVYPLLGFEKFTSVEFFTRERRGEYMPDRETARMILDETAREPGPYFVFANTAENHTPWFPGKFGRNTIRVAGLPPDGTAILETYAEGCRRADAMLKSLVERFAASPDPTLLVWFGDHLPSLGPDYLVYREAGYVTGDDDPEFDEKLHRVPVLVWSNRGLVDTAPVEFGANHLGPHILHVAGLEGSGFTRFLEELRPALPWVPPRRSWGGSDAVRAAVERFQGVQKDIVWGRQELYGAARGHIRSREFVLGHGPLRVDSIDAEKTRGETVTIAVRGHNLPRSLTVFVGEEPAETRWEDYGLVRAQVSTGTQEVEVRVTDEQGAILVQDGPRPVRPQRQARLRAPDRQAAVPQSAP